MTKATTHTLLKTAAASLILGLFTVGIAAFLPVNEAHAETATTNVNGTVEVSDDQSFDELFQWVILTRVLDESENGGDTDLVELMLLSGMFDDNATMGEGDNFMQWILLTEVLGDDDAAENGSTDRDLVDLVVLSQLFSDGGATGVSASGDSDSLMQLILLTEVLNKSEDGQGSRDLVDLIVLSQLFGDEGVSGQSDNFMQWILLTEVLGDEDSEVRASDENRQEDDNRQEQNQDRQEGDQDEENNSLFQRN